MAQPPEDEQEIAETEDERKRRVLGNWKALGARTMAEAMDAQDAVAQHLLGTMAIDRLEALMGVIDALTERMDTETLVPMRYLMADETIKGLQRGIREAADYARPCKHCGVEVAIFRKGSKENAVILTLATGNHHHRECRHPRSQVNDV